MRRYVLILAAADLLAATGLALAGEKIGTIVKIDLPRNEMQIENVVVKIDGVKIEGMQIGDTVKITFDEEEDGDHLQTIEKQ